MCDRHLRLRLCLVLSGHTVPSGSTRTLLLVPRPCLSQERSLHDSSVRLDSVSVEPSDRLLPSAAGGGGGGGAPSGSSWSVVVPSVCMCPVPLGMAHLDFNSRRRAAPPHPSRPPQPETKPAKRHTAPGLLHWQWATPPRTPPAPWQWQASPPNKTEAPGWR